MVSIYAYDSDACDFIRFLVEILNKKVLVSSLNGDSDRSKFGQVTDLIPFADNVIFLTGKCVFCEESGLNVPAPFTLSIGHKKGQEEVGNSQYLTCCRNHHMMYRDKINDLKKLALIGSTGSLCR